MFNSKKEGPSYEPTEDELALREIAETEDPKEKKRLEAEFRAKKGINTMSESGIRVKKEEISTPPPTPEEARKKTETPSRLREVKKENVNRESLGEEAKINAEETLIYFSDPLNSGEFGNENTFLTSEQKDYLLNVYIPQEESGPKRKNLINIVEMIGDDMSDDVDLLEEDDEDQRNIAA
ncbi:MAG: hypothetical protein HQ538_02300 [Parcubacteria group bacterium]|nr:hypothetical protein [Parcubacteria group bacterium]